MIVLRQEHQQSAGNTDLRGQARALAAYGVLDHLHHQRLALEDLLFYGHRRLALARKHRRLATLLALPDIGHMQEGRALQADVDEGRLHAGQHA